MPVPSVLPPDASLPAVSAIVYAGLQAEHSHPAELVTDEQHQLCSPALPLQRAANRYLRFLVLWKENPGGQMMGGGSSRSAVVLSLATAALSSPQCSNLMYLGRCVLHPFAGLKVVPMYDIDLMWHAHMAHSGLYRKDMQAFNGGKVS
jgi:hypothetical protein